MVMGSFLCHGAANLRCITVVNHSLETEDLMVGSSEISASMRTRMPLLSFEENKRAEIYIYLE